MPDTEPEARPSFIARTIAASAGRPLMTLAIVAALGAWGGYALLRAPLDAIPDLSDTQVIVFTEWPGRSPDLVEDQITYPISTSLLAAPKVESVRGQSFFGLSFVTVIFEDGTDMYWARSRVLEYMSSAEAGLPDGVRPALGPDATGVGWVFQYALVDKTGNLDLQELRSLQDWNLRFALESVPGVAEVASVGGFVKEYQVQIDPIRLRGYVRFATPTKTRAVGPSRSRDTNRSFEGGATFKTSTTCVRCPSSSGPMAPRCSSKMWRSSAPARQCAAASPSSTAREKSSAASSSCAMARTRFRSSIG
jgi:hypothetical protein